MSPYNSSLSLETSFSTSPLRIVELLHLDSWRVADTTYLGRLFNLSAHSPFRDSHRAANHSSLRRPSSSASAPSASSSLSLAHASRSLSPIWSNQPPRPKPSSPVGSRVTPSSETFSLTMIFPIVVLLGRRCQLALMETPRRQEKWRPPTAPFVLRAVSTDGGSAAKSGEKVRQGW